MIGLPFLSVISGWLYVLCWGASLYPPVLLNYRTKSVEGVSFDYLFLNFWGSLSYLISVCMLYFSTIVRLEYALQENEDKFLTSTFKLPLVRFNDVIYGLNSLALILVLLYQFLFSGYRRNSHQKLSKTVKALTVVSIAGSLFLLFHAYKISKTKNHYQLIDLANFLGALKIMLSAVKYIPQAYYNYTRKSMKGFAMQTCVFDIAGSIFCLIQLYIDSYLAKDLGSILKHPAKLLLCIVTMFFGLVFVAQDNLYKQDREISVYNKRQR